MIHDDVTVPVPGAILQSLLCDHDRLQSLAMLAVSHAESQLSDVRRLRALLRLATGPRAKEARQDALIMLERIAGQLESRVRDDAALITTALRNHGQQDWPFALRDPLAPPVRH
ncbi:hypothetical protein [Paraburkholderia guartelaensis]|uniref:hypothetical protein n=1 Tax=Paraburkholderia guartelaensis TaxID=2546446 RepID=UPI002AB79A55|nr:hypothetical protein [Paraburkholderia guartelaensis]